MHSKPKLILNDHTIDYSVSARNLGVFFDSRLSWDVHASHVCSRIYGALRAIRNVCDAVPINAKLQLMKSIIVPILTYCDGVYSNCSVFSMNKLKVAVNDCLRFVYSLQRGSHITPYQKYLLGCDFDSFYDIRLLQLIHSIVYNRSPTYLREKLIAGHSNRSNVFRLPNRVLTHYSDSGLVRGTALWNCLPSNIKNVSSKGQFRLRCREFINSNTYRNFISRQ